MIAIIDYGMGNLRSVQKALEQSGAETIITQKRDVLLRADKVVLPGVGAIKPAMDKLNDLDLIPAIKDIIKTGKPFLGICLGLQLFFETSNEGGDVKGLGIIPGTVERFHQLKVPQMGWNQIFIQQRSCPLWKGIDDESNVYFCHSFYVQPSQEDVISTKTEYGVSYTSSIAKDNLFGVQFHPEKSQTIGLKILKNFTEL